MATKVGSPDHPTGDEKAKKETMQAFIHADFPGDMMICAGHGDLTDYETVMKQNHDLIDQKR